MPNIYSLTDEQRIYIHFCVFHPKHPLDIFQYSGIIVRYFLLRPERDYRQRFLLQFEEPELLPEMPFDIGTVPFQYQRAFQEEVQALRTEGGTAAGSRVQDGEGNI